MVTSSLDFKAQLAQGIPTELPQPKVLDNAVSHALNEKTF